MGVEITNTLSYLSMRFTVKKIKNYIGAQMQALLEREVLLERRQYNPDKSVLWDKLTLAQKFAASSLAQFGYNLAFIRHTGSSSLAILLCNGNAATIIDDGQIDTSPNIHIRP